MSCGEGVLPWFLRARGAQQWAIVTQQISSKGSSLSEPWWGPAWKRGSTHVLEEGVEKPRLAVTVVGGLALGPDDRVWEPDLGRRNGYVCGLVWALWALKVRSLSLLPLAFSHQLTRAPVTRGGRGRLGVGALHLSSWELAAPGCSTGRAAALPQLAALFSHSLSLLQLRLPGNGLRGGSVEDWRAHSLALGYGVCGA
uniref:Uncharacterized protein n=1 Tax=Pipistrellus kuhlii TaxID=59472 RepID=A0A7J7W3I7_PIPKU|nr:hypothetical protein mPipKuh1_008161 [Pipistrellus kuhlii]